MSDIIKGIIIGPKSLQDADALKQYLKHEKCDWLVVYKKLNLDDGGLGMFDFVAKGTTHVETVVLLTRVN